MRHILAIDQGTTGSRAIVYDKRGARLASAYREFPQCFPQPGWVEHDPAEIWQSACSAVQAVLQEVPAASIAGIGIANQRETTVVWDRDTGEPIHNAIVWQCRRTAPRCDELRDQADLICRKNGPPARRLLLGDQGRVDPAKRPRRAGEGKSGQALRSARRTPGCSGSSPAGRSTQQTSPTPPARCSWTSTRSPGTTKSSTSSASRAPCCPR